MKAIRPDEQDDPRQIPGEQTTGVAAANGSNVGIGAVAAVVEI